MKKFLLCFSFIAFFSCTDDREIPKAVILPSDYKLVHYWNFNTLPTGTISNPVYTTFSANTTASVSYVGTGAGYTDLYTPGSVLNLRNNDAEGSGIRFRNPSNTKSVIITASTVGYRNIVVQFATYRTGSGAQTQNYSYSVDGINYITTQLSQATLDPNIEPSFGLVTLFITNTVAYNNPNFKFKIDFAGTNASGTSGNNRFDNLTIDGLEN